MLASPKLIIIIVAVAFGDRVHKSEEQSQLVQMYVHHDPANANFGHMINSV